MAVSGTAVDMHAWLVIVLVGCTTVHSMGMIMPQEGGTRCGER